ncbi:MAG: cydA, partial [Chlamydiia bacterium]|nr:cydA [Chlamydiia bacterium]
PMNAEILHRIQFGFSITFHYIYPPMSIGLSLAILFFEAMYLKTKSPMWEQITKFWTRVFALTFALGVATGIPMVFSFGTNWARYSRFIGDVMGSTLAAEGLFAFAMEAGFLGILLFGWGKVSPFMHFLAAFFVSFGAHFSGFWITCVNSWMQTPAGYALVKNAKGEEHAVVTDWLEMLLNHSSITHCVHVLFSTWITGAFLIISVSSYYLLKKRHQEFAIKSIKVALLIGTFSVFAQLASADHLARTVAKYNPEKFASFEGVYKTVPYTEAYAFGWVDPTNQKIYGLGIPGMLSFLVHRDFQEPVPGLDQFPREEWPNVPLVFQVYHLMIAMWGLMVIGTFIGLWMWRKNEWQMHPLLMKYLIISVAFPQIASLSGWYAAEFGRQPWTVYKLLKTSQAYSPGVSANQALFSLCLIMLLYLTFFVLFLVLLNQKIKHGPTDAPEEAPYRDPFKQH